MIVVLIIFLSIMFVSFVTGVIITVYEKEHNDKRRVVEPVVESSTIKIKKLNIKDDIEELVLSIPTIESDCKEAVCEEPVIIEVINESLELGDLSNLRDEDFEII